LRGTAENEQADFSGPVGDGDLGSGFLFPLIAAALVDQFIRERKNGVDVGLPHGFVARDHFLRPAGPVLFHNLDGIPENLRLVGRHGAGFREGRGDGVRLGRMYGYQRSDFSSDSQESPKALFRSRQIARLIQPSAFRDLGAAVRRMDFT
jgi:hypothetical protein